MSCEWEQGQGVGKKTGGTNWWTGGGDMQDRVLKITHPPTTE